MASVLQRAAPTNDPDDIRDILREYGELIEHKFKKGLLHQITLEDVQIIIDTLVDLEGSLPSTDASIESIQDTQDFCYSIFQNHGKQEYFKRLRALSIALQRI